MTIGRLFPLSGIVFVVLLTVSIVALGGSTPESSASGAEVASFYDEQTGRQGLTAFAVAACVPFLVFFGVGLATALSPGRPWAHVLLAGTFLAAGAVLLDATIRLALVDAADHEIAPTALQSLNAVSASTWVAFNAGLGVMMLGAAGALLSARALRWLGWPALVLGIALFIPYADFVALLLTGPWIVAAGVATARDAGGVRHPAPAPAL